MSKASTATKPKADTRADVTEPPLGGGEPLPPFDLPEWPDVQTNGDLWIEAREFVDVEGVIPQMQIIVGDNNAEVWHEAFEGASTIQAARAKAEKASPKARENLEPEPREHEKPKNI
jgi:hypothetical protein